MPTYKMRELGSTREEVRQYFREGDYGISILAACLGISLLLVGSVMLLILVKGFAHFMPRDLFLYEVQRGDAPIMQLAGEVQRRERITRQILIDSGYEPASATKQVFNRLLVKSGNRNPQQQRDFIWLLEDELVSVVQEPDLMVIERYAYGNFYGTPVEISTAAGATVAYGSAAWAATLAEQLAKNAGSRAEIAKIQSDEIDKINYRLERLRLRERRLELEQSATVENLAPILAARAVLSLEYQEALSRYELLQTRLNEDVLLMRRADGGEEAIPFSQIVRLYQSNLLGFWGRAAIYLERLVEFIAGQPRESNTEGGVFPAILGTVMMVLLMTILVMPLGVVAAIYLYLYARQGVVTQTIRIAVNNLAGVPSIVFGMFGLGFFVYIVGGGIDRVFFPEALPTPTFGSGGILWASLTLALLTLPVVIVATEEGLTRIPRHLSEGSLALGATRFETLWRVSLPIVSPSIMTGMILAVARATGEVAPLMLVGVVKLAPAMPIDGNFPFLHLERKFMHLGFHIYDVGFQSPNVEAARPLIYATAALLLLVVVVLNAMAIIVRNRLREKYKNLA